MNKLSSVLKYSQPTNYIVKDDDYDEKYTIPVLTAGKSFLLGYTNEKEGIFTDVPTIIFDDFTTSFHYVDFPFKVKSSAMKMLTPRNDDVHLKYVYYQMLGKRIDTRRHKRYWISQFSKLKIPLPPLPVQERIASILDDAAALRDKAEQLLTEYDLLAQSIFLEMFGDPVINPKGWQKKSLQNLTSKIGSGATPRGGKNAYKKEGISLIRSLNVHDNEFSSKDLAFIDEKQAKKLNNVIIEENDVLINITGASVTRCAIVPNNILPARVNQHVSILRCRKDKLIPQYLLHLMISPNSKVDLLRISVIGGATREAITKSELQNYKIPVPPLDLQNQFTEKVQLIEHQKKIVRQELQESEDLFQALLQKAFKGELV